MIEEEDTGKYIISNFFHLFYLIHYDKLQFSLSTGVRLSCDDSVITPRAESQRSFTYHIY